MKEKNARILATILVKPIAIIMFALVIYFTGHTIIWLLSCFAHLEWVTYWPMKSGEGVLRVFMSVWLVISFIISFIFTK